MSLDVCLQLSGTKNKKGSGIFIRENGTTKEISREEWDLKFPGREPVVLLQEEDNVVFSANITHNLGKMADKSGIYYHLWRPEEKGYVYAQDIVGGLEEGLKKLKDTPAYYKEFDSPNGWGVYENLVEFVEEYLVACKKFPQAKIEVDR